MKQRNEKRINVKLNLDLIPPPSDLEHQIKIDLRRMDIRINDGDEPVTDFEIFCAKLDVSPTILTQNNLTEREANIVSFMGLLHQGVVAEIVDDVFSYLNGTEYFVSQNGSPTTIHAEFKPEENIQKVTVQQKLKLCAPDGQPLYSIEVIGYIDNQFTAKISWQFI